MEVDVGLHHTSPPPTYIICEHSGTLSAGFPHNEGSPLEALADFGADVEYATDAFRTLGIALPFALNKRILSLKASVTSFLFDETNVSTATKPSVSPCSLTEWRWIVAVSAAQMPSTYHLLQRVPYLALN